MVAKIYFAMTMYKCSFRGVPLDDQNITDMSGSLKLVAKIATVDQCGQNPASYI